MWIPGIYAQYLVCQACHTQMDEAQRLWIHGIKVVVR